MAGHRFALRFEFPEGQAEFAAVMTERKWVRIDRPTEHPEPIHVRAFGSSGGARSQLDAWVVDTARAAGVSPVSVDSLGQEPERMRRIPA